MRANNVIGMIYSNAYDSVMPELTSVRTMGSVPFGGRYRLIDFALSNMVNCGMSKVGVVTKSNYQSLMDHLGSGKPWDLSRKNDGIFILPPFSSTETGIYNNRIEALRGSMRFITRSKEEYVLLADCNVICNLDLNKVFEAHEKNCADVTIVYKNGIAPALPDLMTFDFDGEGKITGIALGDESEHTQSYSLNMFLMRKETLIRLVNVAVSLHLDNFERDLFQANVNNLKMYGYEQTGFVRVLSGLQSYYDANMDLLVPDKRRSLFVKERAVFTKVRDEMPSIYGLGSDVKNSLVADGCVIDGAVENCILFRGVHVCKGATVKNSIIMQGALISENVELNSVVIDKNAVIKPGKKLCGDESYPVYIGKERII